MAFRFCDFDAVGFDVDHAFVQYKLENLFPVSCLSKLHFLRWLSSTVLILYLCLYLAGI